MSRKNREKRAAKQRARQRHGTPPPHTSLDALVDGLLGAAAAYQNGHHAAAQKCAGEFTGGSLAERPRTVGVAADMALHHVISATIDGGWLPVDLHQITRRRLDVRAAGLIAGAVASATAEHSPVTVHTRWEDQLRQLDATVWWEQGRPHLTQWALWHGLDLKQALVVVITAIAELMTLPKLPRIVAPPGAATRSRHPTSNVDQKVLGRVRALLAKAEATPYPEEAEVLSAKAQELMNRHAFERALLDATEHKPQTATSCRLWLDSPYLEAKAQLVHTVAEANRCRAVFHKQLGFVSLVGAEMDLEITELLTTSLLVQAAKAMAAEGRRTTSGGTSRTRSFRQSFLVGYAVRIGERLRAASEAAHDSAEDSRLLPVLADRERVVDETFQEMFAFTYARGVTVNDGEGWQAGLAAADRADLSIDRTAVRP